MKLEDIDKLAETKRDLEQIAAREQRAREARKLGVVTPSSRPAGMAYHGGDDAVLVSPTDDEELVEEVRAAVLNWCARRRRGLRSTLEDFGVEVADV